MKKLTHGKAIIAAAVASLAAVALAGCFAITDPDGGNSGGSGNGGIFNPGNSGNGGSLVAEDYVPFDTVFITADGSKYVGLPWSFPHIGADANEGSSNYSLAIPGMTSVEAADYFAVYDGKLFFTDFLRPTDAAARKTSLFMANLDGSGATEIVSDVACGTKPYIINGVLYYNSFDFHEGARTYSFTGVNGTQIVESDVYEATGVLRSYNLTTGETNSVTIAETSLMGLIGATRDRIYVVEENGSDASKCASYSLDFTDKQEFSLPGYPEGIDEAGHILVYSWDSQSNVQFFICDATGNTLATFNLDNYYGYLVQNRYFMYTKNDRVLYIYDTVAMKQIKEVGLKDNFASHCNFFMYDTDADVAYFLGYHGSVEGAYDTWDSTSQAISVFSVDAAGQVRRVVPDSANMWRRTGSDYTSARAYVLQWSEIDFYTYDQLNTLSNEELFYGRNEMYWAHGKDFTSGAEADAELQAFFEAKTWPRELVGTEFTAAEKENFALICQIELERNSPYATRGYNGMMR